MTLVIVVILLIAYVLIATELLTKVNKAAVAVFAGTVGWILYICYGTDFVMSQHPNDYFDFLSGAVPTSSVVKEYIAQNVFLKYVGRGAEIVLFLLATMTIVEILHNNGCFDFVSQLLKTRRSRRLLWALSIITFIISANLDNLTTTVMMLTVMRRVVPQLRMRLYFGAAIVLAANCGGALTVIGDPTGLFLWNMGHVTPTAYSSAMALPCLTAWLLPTWWIGRSLPETTETEWVTMPYRGDDTRLNIWQRLLMLFVGIGGLWFIPTFHRITKLSPFLGAFCVLAVLWVVNEIFNRRLIDTDEMMQRRVPRVAQLDNYVGATWVAGTLAAALSTVLDSFTSALTFFTIGKSNGLNSDYWSMIAYSTAVGGNILCVGSLSGVAFLKTENARVGWYISNVGWKAFVGAALGLAVMIVM